MALTFIFHRFKLLFLMIIGVWRRALCIFRRKRRPSCDGVPLTTVDVITNHSVYASTSGLTNDQESDLQNWNSWDENNQQTSATPSKPSTIQQHIELYRQQAAAAITGSPEQEEEPPEFFFQDMTPKITGQMKIHVGKTDEHSTNDGVDRLSLAPEFKIPTGQLGEWEESAGWEDESKNDWENAEVMLREKRRQERERRAWEQQQRRQQRNSKTNISLGAAKIPT